MNDNFEELLNQFALDDKNYKNWRKIHTKAFGKVFSHAFKDNDAAQIHLTAALIKISQRAFEQAAPKLEELANMCATPFDSAALHYFTGLNHEMMGNLHEMNEHYEALGESPFHFEFPISFHPYYRTAKFAQRASECSKALYYYQKALEYYSQRELSKNDCYTASFILYDMATVYLYMHEYDAAERLLSASHQYSDTPNSQRDYVTAILYAIQGKKRECDTILENLPGFFQDSCKPMVSAIRAGTDPHYFAVPQDRSNYGKFAETLLSQQKKLKDLIVRDSLKEAEDIISDLFFRTFRFTGRVLECKILPHGEKITVHCKHYRIQTLIAEQEALFAMSREELPGWEFVPVSEFEPYPDANAN